MEKDAAGYPSLPLHYGLMNPGTSRTSPAAYPTSRAVLRGGGGGDVTSLPDTWVGNHPGLPGQRPPELRHGIEVVLVVFLTEKRSAVWGFPAG